MLVQFLCAIISSFFLDPTFGLLTFIKNPYIYIYILEHNFGCENYK